MSVAATNEVLRQHGFPEVTEAEYELGTKYTTPRRFAFHAGCKDLADPLGEKLGAAFDELYVGWVTPSMCPMFDGMDPLLRDLLAGGCRLGALSNACGAYVRTVLEAHGLADSFSVQLGADGVPAAKPAPDGLWKCCEALGVSPAECAYVGDAPTDGDAARAAGMRCIGVTWGSHALDGSEFDVVVNSTADLRAALMAWTGQGTTSEEGVLADAVL